jgi:hypothetical protein
MRDETTVEKLYDPYEASAISGFHHQTIREYCRLKKIKGTKVDGNWKISEEALLDWMRDQIKKGLKSFKF